MNKSNEMKGIKIISLLVMFASAAFAQEQDTSLTITGEIVYSHVEEMPEYPGGETGFKDFLTRCPYPKKARRQDIQGRVFVYFVIEKDGSYSDLKIKRGADPLLDNAVMDYMKTMQSWKPGRENGQLARVHYTVPFNFSLTESKK